ncbi:MAG: alpha-amylase family glycosyl hydrolase [Fervidobacterium sp.]
MIGYEIFIRSFADSNDDGIGDFRGIAQKVDYFKMLGVDLIWLTPHFKSPSYHGYDIIDYFDTNSSFGSLEDFRYMVDTLHANKIKLIIDLPLNHVSDRHPWFKAAMNDEKPYVDYFLWAQPHFNTAEKRHWDEELLWHNRNGKWYYGVFGGSSPDLNYENPEVVEKSLEIVEFWLKQGVDGFRFDAAKHIYDYDIEEGKFRYNHDKNVNYWQLVMDKARSVKGTDVFAVTEVWDDPEIVDRYAKTIGCSFNFYFTEAIRESMQHGAVYKIVDCFQRTLTKKPYKPSNFTGNHDMHRLAQLLPQEEQRKVFFGLLMTTPGVPFIYYGDELGMKGMYDSTFTEDVIEPFPWYASLSGEGQTFWKAVRFNRAFTGVSVEEQINREASLLKEVINWTNFRKENSWLENAWIENVTHNTFTIAYTVTDGLHGIRVYVNISGHRENFEGVSLKPYEVKVM